MKKVSKHSARIAVVCLVLTMLISSISVNAASWNLNDSNRARYAGANRYDTSLLTADALKQSLGVSKFDTVVLAYGENYPDALAGGYLANKNSAPVIIVDSIHRNGKNKTSETNVINYLKSNLKSGGKVYILGGTGVVSTGFENKLNSRGYNVERLAGDTRYSTNLEILKEVGKSSKSLFVCSGTGFADSLSVSAVDIPTLIVNKSITAEQKAYIASVNPSNIYIIGGTAAVNSSIEKSLKSGYKVTRIAGPNRYSTSVAIANSFFDSSSSSSIVLAYAKNFPDGLSGGPLAASLGAPLVLTETNNYKDAQAYRQSTSISLCATLGGTKLISDYAVEEIMRDSEKETTDDSEAKLREEIATLDAKISELESKISETENAINNTPSEEEKAAAAKEKEDNEAKLVEEKAKLEETNGVLSEASSKTSEAESTMNKSAENKNSAESSAKEAENANKVAEDAGYRTKRVGP